MSPLTDPISNDFSQEFTCRGCGSHEAHRSRPRNFFERHLLPWMTLQPVRCEHCYRRSYVFESVEARERRPPDAPQPQSSPTGDSKTGARVA